MSDFGDEFTDFTGADNHKRDAIPLGVFGISEQPSINSVIGINNNQSDLNHHPPPPKFSKGQAVHYRNADGSWVPAKIISVDLSIQPPSYGIELSDGKCRETEQHRLSDQPPSIHPPTTNLAQEEEDEDEADGETDNFGDFEAAIVSENQNIQPTASLSLAETQSVIEEQQEEEDAQEQHYHQPPPPLPPSPSPPPPPPPPPPPIESPKTKRMEIIEQQLRKLQVEDNNSTSNSIIIEEEEEDADDWGDFDQATSLQPPSPPPPPPRNPNAVSEYGIAWSLILKSAHQILQSGHTILSTANNDGLLHQLTQHPTGVDYIHGLCRVYFVAQILQIAAMQLGLLDLVVELKENWRQCHEMVMTSPLSSLATTSNSSDDDGNNNDSSSSYKTLEQVMTTVVQGRHLLERIDVIRERIGAMEGDEFPRVLEYSSDSKGGVCGLTLLPLSVFEDDGGDGGGVVMVEEFGWMNRRCLVPVANLWLHRVSSIPPELD